MVGWHPWLNRHGLSRIQELMMDRKAWRAAVRGATKSWTWLNNWTELNWIINDVEPLFMWLIVICISSLKKWLFMFFANFWMELFGFFWYLLLFIKFFLSALYIYQPTTFQLTKYLMRNLLIILLKSSCMWQVTSLFCFQDSFLVFVYQKFNYNVSCCDSLWIHLFRVPWTSWMLIFNYVFLSNWENLQSSFSNILSLHLSFSSLTGIPTKCVLVHLIVSHSSFRLSSLFFNLFSFSSSNSIIYVVLSSSLLIFFFCWLKSVFEPL